MSSTLLEPHDTTGPSGETKPPDSPLEIYRHSSAHLLAAAVTELFPDAQCGIGPPTEDGFFYDFLVAKPFTPEDLAAIEKRMADLAAKDEPVTRRVLPRDDAVAHFKQMGRRVPVNLDRRIGRLGLARRSGGVERLQERRRHLPAGHH